MKKNFLAVATSVVFCFLFSTCFAAKPVVLLSLSQESPTGYILTGESRVLDFNIQSPVPIMVPMIEIPFKGKGISKIKLYSGPSYLGEAFPSKGIAKFYNLSVSIPRKGVGNFSVFVVISEKKCDAVQFSVRAKAVSAITGDLVKVRGEAYGNELSVVNNILAVMPDIVSNPVYVAPGWNNFTLSLFPCADHDVMISNLFLKAGTKIIDIRVNCLGNEFGCWFRNGIWMSGNINYVVNRGTSFVISPYFVGDGHIDLTVADIEAYDMQTGEPVPCLGLPATWNCIVQ